MKKIYIKIFLKIMIVFSFPCLFAMRHNQENYQLVSVLVAKYATDMVTFVKKIDDTLIIFDRKGCGEMWNIANEPAFIKELWKIDDVSSLDNAFFYKDSDDQVLLVSAGKSHYQKLYLHNLTQTESSWCKKKFLHTGYEYKLYQKASGTLVMQNIDSKLCSKIYPSWQLSQEQYKTPRVVLYSCKNIDAGTVKVRNEGVIASASKLQSEEKLRISKDCFNLEYLTAQQKKLLSPYGSIKCIECYHKNKGLLICGYDWGVVAIWKVSELNTAVTEGTDVTEECPICTESMSQGTIRKLICMHNFHNECIEKWLSKSRTCPYCRAEIS